MSFSKKKIKYCLGFCSEWQVRGVRGFPTRHDRQRLGLAQQRQGGLQQSVDQSQSHFVRRERQLLRDCGQPARQVLVPRVLAVQVQGARAADGPVRHLGRAAEQLLL
jgi:hypothetical protein